MSRYNMILPELLVGACPAGAREISQLRQEAGISAILSLQTDEDLQRLGIDWPQLLEFCLKEEMLVERIPIVDFDAADLRTNLPAAAARLHRMIELGNRVYLHCNLGMERSPSLAIAYLAWYRAWPLDQAWEHVKQHRDCAPNFEAVWLAHRARTASGDSPG